MKALVYNEPKDIGYEDFRDPVPGEAREILVQIERRRQSPLRDG